MLSAQFALPERRRSDLSESVSQSNLHVAISSLELIKQRNNAVEEFHNKLRKRLIKIGKRISNFATSRADCYTRAEPAPLTEERLKVSCPLCHVQIGTNRTARPTCLPLAQRFTSYWPMNCPFASSVDEDDEDEIGRRFARHDFSPVGKLPCGDVIRKCWTGVYDDAFTTMLLERCLVCRDGLIVRRIAAGISSKSNAAGLSHPSSLQHLGHTPPWTLLIPKQ